MRVLVTAASRHGATREIAEAIGDELTCRGVTVTVLPVEMVESIDAFDAVVLGSGIYMGHWLSPARTFVERFWDELVMMPVWLFSSGPVGEPLRPVDQPVDLGDVEVLTVAREHRIFPGRIAKESLGLSEKAICKALSVPEGDFRDWAEVRDWAVTIAEDMQVNAAIGR